MAVTMCIGAFSALSRLGSHRNAHGFSSLVFLHRPEQPITSSGQSWVHVRLSGLKASWQRPRRTKRPWSAKALDAACLQRAEKKHGATPVREPYVIDCNGRTVNAVYDEVPCLTRARCMSGGYFLTHKQCFMSVQEMLQLQGFPRDLAEEARDMAITPRSLAGMVGNALSVDLLEVLLDRVVGALHMASLI